MCASAVICICVCAGTSSEAGTVSAASSPQKGGKGGAVKGATPAAKADPVPVTPPPTDLAFLVKLVRAQGGVVGSAGGNGMIVDGIVGQVCHE